MSHWIDLDTPEGTVRTWREDPPGAPRGGIVLLQEIFGANAHIRDVARRLAAEGYAVLAPALFDPVEPGVDLAYDEAGLARGRELAGQLGFERAIAIVSAAAALLQGESLAVGAVGFCWGGSLAFLANTRLGLPAVSYYGARTAPFLDEPTRAPMLFHFGGQDPTTPAADIALHRERQPAAAVFVYPDAGHAFNRDVDSAVYHPKSAALAWRRTLDFLADALR